VFKFSKDILSKAYDKLSARNVNIHISGVMLSILKCEVSLFFAFFKVSPLKR
jgi:hypothetical protein